MSRWIAGFLCFAACLAVGADVDSVIADVRKDLAAARRALQSQRERLAGEREQRRGTMAQLEDKLKQESAAQTGIRAEQEEADAALQSATAATEELRAHRAKALLSIRENRKELVSAYVRAKPVGDDFDQLDELLLPNDPAATAAAGNLLWQNYLAHFSRCTAIETSDVEAVRADGTTVKGRLRRIGGLGGTFVGDDITGLVRTKLASDQYHLSGTELNGELQEVIRRGNGRVVLDITEGKALGQLQQRRSLTAFLKAGGPVVIPLVLVALAALVMVLERAIYLSRVDSNVDRLLDLVVPLVEQGKYDDALTNLENGKGPVRRVLRSGIEQGRRTTENLEEILQESILAELPSLERFLGALAVLAAIAPLLGLLGTVSGMISTFQVISVYGTGNAKLLSSGISEALITTEIGLIVAVPILLAHAWLNRHVRNLVAHMDRAAVSLISVIRKARPKIINR